MADPPKKRVDYSQVRVIGDSDAAKTEALARELVNTASPEDEEYGQYEQVLESVLEAAGQGNWGDPLER